MTDTVSAIVAKTRRDRSKPALFVGLAGASPATPSARISLAGLDRVEIVRGETRAITRTHIDGTERLTLALPDRHLSTTHARLSRLGSSWVVEDLGSKNGVWIDHERVSRRPLADADAVLLGHTALVFRQTGGEAPDATAEEGDLPGFATLSPVLAARFAQLATGARAPVTVAITGETGTGKELVARAIHVLSGRTGAFIAVNCGALSPTILEAELFGHRRGAFTGASEDRLGLIRSADGGTLFLDEVAELPLASQTALLRVLQEGEVVPVGSDRPVKLDLRIVTATHRDLDAEVAANRFRADLRGRLLGLVAPLPPLRERPEDLALLVATLLRRVAPGRELAFSADAIAALYAHDWPLNVRELERSLAAAVAVCGPLIELEHLPAALQRFVVDPADEIAELSADDQALRDQLAEAIALHAGNLAAVGRALGKDRTQIRRWMRRFGISRRDGET